MKCLLINIIVFVNAVNSDNYKPVLFPQLPVLEFNMAVKDSIGGWKENFYLCKTSKTCSSLKMFLGDSWIPMWAVSGVPNATCPIPVATYRIPGIDTSVINASNFPKTFFYGTYKFRIMYSKNNEVIGCTIIVVEIKRPWETNN